MAVCDFCNPKLGDHDKPYRSNTLVAMRARFTNLEIKKLIKLRVKALENNVGSHMDSYRPPEEAKTCSCGSAQHGEGACSGS